MQARISNTIIPVSFSDGPIETKHIYPAGTNHTYPDGPTIRDPAGTN